jgi:predicted Fe-Mo cluster-binding NifX family protein
LSKAGVLDLSGTLLLALWGHVPFNKKSNFINKMNSGENDFLIAFGTDDGKSLNDDHVGMAKYFYVYRFCGDKKEFVEKRENVKFKGDESIKHGDPKKAKATSSVLEDIDVVVGKKFGPNIVRLLKKFVCVVVREETLNGAIDAACCNLEKILEQKNKADRKHLVL